MKGILILSILGISLVACQPICHAANTNFYGFTVCEIAHPDNCHLIGLWQNSNVCGRFIDLFNKSGLIFRAGETITTGNDCVETGLEKGCYHFDNGNLKGPFKNLKLCRMESMDCFCPSGPIPKKIK